uniref:Ribosomal protein S14 n=1 Tax=Physarum polycephalum TaxID=5791 RepID=F2Y9U8_PHYPO|nr:ribosomal protein S14 [Physarum polycephalum]
MISILQTSIKDKKQRMQFKASEMERRYYKLMKLQATNIGFMPLRTLPKVQLKNYCLITGRARSIYSKKFRISRHQIKAYFTYISGLRNSSW